MFPVAGSRTFWMALVVTVLITGVPAFAGTVDIFSGPHNGSNSVDGANTAIAVSPAWAIPPTGSTWISYGATGCNTFVVLTGTCTPGSMNPPGTTVTSAPTATFYQTFTITDAADWGNLDVWADDTAGVWLDTGTVTGGDGSGGQLLWAPNGTLGPQCVNGPIGCIQGMDAVIPLNLTTGTYTLVIDAYQLIGGSPFGVMYNGVLSDSSTPEPATLALMGLGLAGLGVMLRRRRA